MYALSRTGFHTAFDLTGFASACENDSAGSATCSSLDCSDSDVTVAVAVPPEREGGLSTGPVDKVTGCCAAFNAATVCSTSTVPEAAAADVDAPAELP